MPKMLVFGHRHRSMMIESRDLMEQLAPRQQS
jgi:hypothetical protein